jgi:hypothetical protein
MIEVSLPKTYDTITLKQYVDFMCAKTDVTKAMVATGKTRAEVESMLYQTIDFINESFYDACEKGTPRHEQTFGAGGMHIGFIPDLNSLSFREFVDLDALSQQVWTKDGVDFKELPRLMAILFRPIEAKVGKFYTLKPYSGDSIPTYIDYINQMTMDRVNGALVFFSTIERESLLNSQAYSLKQMRMMMMETSQLQADLIDGDGITSLSQ